MYRKQLDFLKIIYTSISILYRHCGDDQTGKKVMHIRKR